jgi:hypothetical protein
VSGIPKVYGTGAADALTGDDGPNELHGLGGRDVVRGMGGDDVLTGDTVDGGAGDDSVDGGFLGGRVRCGAGRDTVIGRPRARVADDCEHLRFDPDAGAAQHLNLHLRLPRASAAFLSGIRGCGCDRPERWTARAGATLVAALSPTARRSALRLNAAGRRRLARAGRLAVRVELRTVDDYDRPVRVPFRLDLRVTPP